MSSVRKYKRCSFARENTALDQEVVRLRAHTLLMINYRTQMKIVFIF